jgi:HEAT repeat protein
MTTVAGAKDETSDRLSELLEELGDGEGTVRHRARVALVTAGDVAVPGLISALASSNSDARWEAAKALTEVRDERAIPALLDALRDERPGVRWLAAQAVGEMGRTALEPVLLGLMQHSHSVWFRDGAHHILAVLGRGALHDAIQPVLKALDSIEPEIAVLVPCRELLAKLRAAAGEGQA